LWLKSWQSGFWRGSGQLSEAENDLANLAGQYGGINGRKLA